MPVKNSLQRLEVSGYGIEILVSPFRCGFRRNRTRRTMWTSNLGYDYKNGIGVAANRVLTWNWLTLAAKKGYTKARGFIETASGRDFSGGNCRGRTDDRGVCGHTAASPLGTVQPAGPANN